MSWRNAESGARAAMALAGVGVLAIAFASCTSCSRPDQGGARPTPAVAERGVRAARSPSAAAEAFADGVTVHLERTAAPVQTLSFGVPVPRGRLADPSTVRVEVRGEPAAATVVELLGEHGPSGARTGVRAILVQLPGAAMTGDSLDVHLRWRGGRQPGAAAAPVPFASDAVSIESPMVVETANRTIATVGGELRVVESGRAKKTLFVGREPRALATFPAGYLSATGILGEVAPAAAASESKNAGLYYLSSAFRAYALSSMYLESYPLNPHKESVIDPVADYSGWLYDRCATYLVAFTHFGDTRFLRQAHRTCSYFGSRIDVAGPRAGTFAGKPDPDPKYSHLRGLYAYYALTGDERARAAGVSIAEMWYGDPNFVAPYRAGHTRGRDKLWTERLLAASLEGLYYGHRLTGDVKYLRAFEDLLDTAYRHVTGDAAALARINPGLSFPPQNCFVHSGEQQADANASDPWCSPWMSELLVEPLLRYQEQTGDRRVDEIFVRLGRFLRDVGTAYFTKDLSKDDFLSPSNCDNPSEGENRRRLVPLYGAGIGADGKRAQFGEWSDFEHCADATLLTAAALRALRRQGAYDQNPVGPFPSEGASFLQLHHELSACAERVFEEERRPRRDPARWKSAELAAGKADPARFIEENKIGFPLHVQSPQRKLSWWFNGSMLQFELLASADIAVPSLHPGVIQPNGCR